MIREQLIAFRRATGLRPERIIFYRDGVSEGQFSEVLLREFDAIRKACVSLENYHGRVWGPKSASSDKTAAWIAMHMAGERTPVKAKMVKSRYTTGAASLSLTSTSYDPVAINDFEYVMAEKNPEGYIQLHTTHGDLNIERHCDIVAPRACENYITLCEQGYNNGIAFHRNARYCARQFLSFNSD